MFDSSYMSLAMHLYSTCQVKLCWCRSSLSQLFFKIGVLKYFAICTGKQEKRLQHRFFPVNIAKFLRTIFYRTSPVAASVDVQSIEITPKISLSVIHVTRSNVYVFTLIHRKGFICLGQLESEETDQRCCVEDVSFFRQVSSLLFQNEAPRLSN